MSHPAAPAPAFLSLSSFAAHHIRSDSVADPFRVDVGEATKLRPLDLLRRDRGQCGAGGDRGQFADARAEGGERLALEQRAGDEGHRRGVHRAAVAIQLEMEVRAGREAGRADIADHLPKSEAHTSELQSLMRISY